MSDIWVLYTPHTHTETTEKDDWTLGGQPMPKFKKVPSTEGMSPSTLFYISGDRHPHQQFQGDKVGDIYQLDHF